MALTRKFLIALGIEADKVDEIISAHTETTDALKKERDTYKENADKLADVQKELNTANEKLAKYSENGETVSKADYDKLKGEYDNYKADIVAKETRTAKVEALRSLLKGVGISEKRLETVVKTYNLDEIELDKDGKIKDADTRTEAAKTEWADFIETTHTRGANTATPPANNANTSITKDDIYKMNEKGRFVYSPSERQEMLSKLNSQKGN